MWHAEDEYAIRRTCTVCGSRLTGDPDDDPDHPTGPMCGECYRAREDDEIMWALDDADDDDDDDDDDGLW